MPRLVKSAAMAFVTIVAWTIYVGIRGIVISGSGGLGAVSFGVSEVLIEL